MSARSRIRTTLVHAEPLETRLALSGPADIADVAAVLGVVGVEPADGSVTASAPRTLAVEFDREIDDFSLGLNDLRLERLDGTGAVAWSIEDAGLFLEATLDGSGRRVAVTLPDDLTLEPGAYRVVISGWSLLGGLDGTPAVEAGSDRTITSFTLAPRGVTLDDAEDLGTLAPGTILDLRGALDFTADPRAVRLYRFRVPDGHATWRLGAAVAAQADGSALDAALALFDATGRVLAATDKGLRDAPEDPFLYAGLAPGTYYIGVSGVGNVAGRPGNYDPASGLPELVTVARASGPFRLSLVADPADEPTRLVGLTVRRDDPFDPTPTGIELRFSGLVYPKPRDDGGTLVGIRLIGADGRGWSLVGAEFDVDTATLRYAISDRLPPGRYTIVLGNRFPLIDLAGRRPVAPGQPAGVLGTFEVTGRRPPHEASDLGVAFPRDLSRGLTRSIELRPGESYAYRVVATRNDLLRLQLRASGGAGRVEILTSTGGRIAIDLEARARPRDSTRLLDLPAGPFTVRVTATGDALFSLRWTLTTSGADNERLLLNGNGQGPALGLRLIAPAGAETTPTAPGRMSDRPAFDPSPDLPTSPAPSPSPIDPVSVPVIVTPIVLPVRPGAPNEGTTTPVPGPAAPPPTTGPAPSFAVSPRAPSSGLLLAPAAAPIGRPASAIELAGGARPTAGTAEAAMLAARAPTDAPFGRPGQDMGDSSATNPLAPPVELPGDAAPAPAVADDAEVPGPRADVAERGENVEADGGSEGRIAERTELEATEAQPEAAPAQAPLMAASLDPLGLTALMGGDASDPRALKSDLGSPLGAMIVAAAVVEGQRRMRRWLGRRRGLRLAGRIVVDWRAGRT
jgi:hypothetical protein